MSHNKQSAAGFTIIELMLAMVFVALLLLAIAMTTIQVSNIYTRGMTMREVNQAARTVSDQLSRDIAASQPLNLDANEGVFVSNASGGLLCTGASTYVWSTSRVLQGGESAPDPLVRYQDGQPVRFARAIDPGGGLCAQYRSTGTVPNVMRSTSSELLSEGNRDLVAHEFTISALARANQAGQESYEIIMTIGTNDATLLTTSGNQCAPPAETGGGEEYCSVNQFRIVVRAGSGGL